MPGYDPTCVNCYVCPICKGEGKVMMPTFANGAAGRPEFRHERVTCSTCGGARGKPGRGEHNHR